MVPELTMQEASGETASRSLPPADQWRSLFEPGTSDPAGALRLEAGEHPPILDCSVHLRAHRYRAMKVTMRVDAGTCAALRWISDLEPEMDANPGITVPIVADNAQRTYTFDLSPFEAETWAGSIQGLRLYPSNVPANVELISCTLEGESQETPLQITIDGETHDAIMGNHFSWEVKVRQGSVFECSLGMLERAWKTSLSDGVRFEVTLRTASDLTTPILAEVLNPTDNSPERRWHTCQANLGAYAGQTVRLEFTIDHLGSYDGDYAYWGSPTVSTTETGQEETPVILISCDTLRADHVSFYGYDRKTTPFLDAWAEECAVFEHVVTPETWTLTSHMSLLTGLYPKNHNLTFRTNLDTSIPTLPQILAKHQYRTAGFTGHDWWLMPWRGFGRGFDHYSTPELFRDIHKTHNLAKRWIEKHPTRRFFMFLHNYDIHSKAGGPRYSRVYDTGNRMFRAFSEALEPGPSFAREGMAPLNFTPFLNAHNEGKLAITEEEREYLQASYDDGIPYVDDALRDFVAFLKTKNLYDDALIIVTADHGEEFGEHGLYVHMQAYAECRNVPLFIKFPKGQFAGRRIEEVVQLQDLFATVLDVLKLPDIPPEDSKSLLKLMEGSVTPRKWAFSQHLDTQSVCTKEFSAVRNVRTGACDLFRITEDPLEQNDLSAESPPWSKAFIEQLDTFFMIPYAGWHINFSGDGTPWRGAITLSTEDRFEQVGLLDTYRVLTGGFEEKEGVVTGEIKLEDDVKTRELLVQTASPSARVTLTVNSGLPFTVSLPGSAASETTQYEIVLDPGSPSLPRAGLSEFARQAVPTLSLWYGEPTPTGTDAKTPTQQDVENLKALGYL